MWWFDRPGRVALAGVAFALVAGCGFHLRGLAELPFQTLYIPGNDPLAVALRRNVRASSKTRLVTSPAEAQAVFGVTREQRDKVILTFSAAGRVSEYQLRYRVGFRVTDPKGTQVFVPTSEIFLTRDMSYNDAQVLAKDTEEALLYRDMQSDMVQQILRRLEAEKHAVPPVE